MRSPTAAVRRRLALASVVAGTVVGLALSASTPAVAAVPLSPITGAGSRVTALAMRPWTSIAAEQGLTVAYSPLGGRRGLGTYANSQVDFAAPDATLASYGLARPARGYQYVPVAGDAVALAFHLQEADGTPVTGLKLDAPTLARIAIGEIQSWSDPAIAATNPGLSLPDEPITLAEDTTSGPVPVLYDFARATLGAEYDGWYRAHGCGDPAVPPVSLRCTQPVGHLLRFNDEDQVAQYVGVGQGLWSIAPLDAVYAHIYQLPAAGLRNASGRVVFPLPAGVTTALADARTEVSTAPDLWSVFRTRRAAGYPLSTYLTVVTQCRASSVATGCTGPYTDAGVANTLGAFLRLVVCQGQANVVGQGLAELPPQLSQATADAVARITGRPREILTAANCANPAFGG